MVRHRLWMLTFLLKRLTLACAASACPRCVTQLAQLSNALTPPAVTIRSNTDPYYLVGAFFATRRDCTVAPHVARRALHLPVCAPFPPGSPARSLPTLSRAGKPTGCAYNFGLTSQQLARIGVGCLIVRTKRGAGCTKRNRQRVLLG